ncbi:MAG: SDR family NAD(P)-dependent oxidoreductase [Tenericutes bacterium]|nr:SDR family NAD(P)-dependent oxidoreductase [Mycoplasmatota bacterium]
MNKKTIVITGVTSGIGYETAKKLFLEGHHLVFGNRNQEKAIKVKNEFLSLKDGKIDLLEIDLSSFSSIERFAYKVIASYEKIDVLINNAGVFSRKKAYTLEGFELAKGVNHIGTYYLTELLLPTLLKTAKAKVIMVSSVGCYLGRIRKWKDFFNRKSLNFTDYFDSKLANLFYANSLSKKYPELIIKAADPGIAYSRIWKWKTRVGESLDNLYKRITISSEEASRVVVQLASSNIFDKNPNLLFKFNKAVKLPRRLKKKSLEKVVMDLTKEVVDNATRKK